MLVYSGDIPCDVYKNSATSRYYYCLLALTEHVGWGCSSGMGAGDKDREKNLVGFPANLSLLSHCRSHYVHLQMLQNSEYQIHLVTAEGEEAL